MKKNLLEIIIKIIFIGILFYILYRSEIVWSGEQRNFYSKYFILFLIINIIIFTYYKVSEVNKKILKINFYSILFIIYFFELSLNLINLNNKNSINYKSELLKKEGKIFDTRKKLEVYDFLKEDFPNTKLYIPPSNYKFVQNIEIFPLSGISNTKTLYCNENGYWFNYDSDRYGFNNPDKEWNKGSIDFFLIGDSLTMGACVNRPFDTASQIRKIYDKSVINLGMGGNGPLMEFASLKEYLTPNTKNVIWLYSEANDNFELALELKNPILKKYMNDNNFNQNLKDKVEEIDEISEILQKKEISNQNKDKIRDESLKYKILKFIQLKNIKKLFNFKTPKVSFESSPPNEFQKILKKAEEASKKNNSKFYFVYLPRFERYSIDDFKDENYLKIISIVNSLGIKLIDFKAVLDNEQKPLSYFPFGMWGHYNEKGYKLLAKTIIENLK